MGTDITMHIVRGNEILVKNIELGRCYDWFDVLQGRDRDVKPWYDYLKIYRGVPEDIPAEVWKEEDWAFGYAYITVKDFKDWVCAYNPFCDYGWIRKRAWHLYKVKGIDPDYDDIRYTLDHDEIAEDWVFDIFPTHNECFDIVWEIIKENKIPDDAYIVYCFDN